MTPPSETLTVVSWNVNGIRARLPHVVRYLNERAPDVFCLQETKIAYADFPRAELAAIGYRSTVLSSAGYAGVAILTRATLDRVTGGLDGFAPKRPAARRLTGRLGRVWIDTVYVPTRLAIGKIEFLDALREDHATSPSAPPSPARLPDTSHASSRSKLSKHPTHPCRCR